MNLNAVLHRLDRLEREDERVLVEALPRPATFAELLELASRGELSELRCVAERGGLHPALVARLALRRVRAQDGTLWAAASVEERRQMGANRSLMEESCEGEELFDAASYRLSKLLIAVDRRMGPAATSRGGS